MHFIKSMHFITVLSMALLIAACGDEATSTSVDLQQLALSHGPAETEETIVIKPLHDAEWHIVNTSGGSMTAWTGYERTVTRRRGSEQGAQWEEEDSFEAKGSSKTSISDDTECEISPVLLRTEDDIDIWQVTLDYKTETETGSTSRSSVIEFSYDGSGPMQIAGDEHHEIWIRPRDWEE